MVHPNDMVIGGWDISSLNLGEAMKRAEVLDYDLQRQLYPMMKDIKPLPSIYYPDFIAANQADRADNVLKGSKQENLEQIRKQIRDFKTSNGCDKVIVLWSANTERYSDIIEGVNDTSANLLESIKAGEDEISPSTIFAAAPAKMRLRSEKHLANITKRGLVSQPDKRRLMKTHIDAHTAASLVEQKAQEEALYHHTQAVWGDQKIPLKVKLCSTDDQFDEGQLRKLLLKFGEQSMVLYNAVLTGQRVIVLGYNQPAGDVCNYVLAMSSLVCPPLSGLILRQYPYANLTDLSFLSTPGYIAGYPYANLTDLSFLSTPGYIAGVTNPMFKSKREWWDVLCDISNGEVMVSSALAAEKDDYESADRLFVQGVLDGIHAGYSEEWVRCQFEEYTLQNVVDIAMGEANYMDVEALARRTATNNKRITRWARTDNYKSFTEARQRHRCLQGEMVIPDDAEVERIYADFAERLQTEQELLEFLSYLPMLRGGLQAVAQGIYHSSMSVNVKYNTVILLQRLESHPSTASSLQQLNAFVLMTYQRLHNIVQPDVRA
ncbi:hypothetical protein P43SY_006860 [Pythium insidiosum]|uniref:UDENN domain-containing protein n=1 Tax=Pythium insidiosum TaxID=114742 RepID=A0AAD5Q9M7_PYTIN|nr:hypothetical protein P43SY_006860 [Pythium insidiosum]